MAENNRVCHLFGIRYPIIQAGMVWCSGWKLASTVSRCGGLGLIGSGSMRPDLLRYHIRNCKQHTNNPFGVNVPLLYPDIDQLMDVIIDEQVPIVVTSAGNPARWTPWLKERGVLVAHVVPNVTLARKCEERGVDAVICEGFEAGGHNGKDEITTMCLVPQVVNAVSIPVVAAGGIGSGQAVAAAFALGAEGVQIGSRFAVTAESSAHPEFKNAVVKAGDQDTMLTLKKVVPVRMMKNDFFNRVFEAEQRCADRQELLELLGKGRARAGIFEGDLREGELEIGQVSGQISDIPSATDLFNRILQEFRESVQRLNTVADDFFPEKS